MYILYFKIFYNEKEKEVINKLLDYLLNKHFSNKRI